MTSVLSGRVVLVTGAARGIGAHTARLAAARGARLALVGLEPDRLADLARELGGQHAWFRADVTDQAALAAAVRGTLDRYGRIDAVVANAGVANRGTVAAGEVAALVRTVEVNLIGVIRTASATAAALIASRGYLLIVSSAAAFAALPGMAAYCASKAGAEQFGNALRLELAHHGVSVGTAHMSWVDTDLVRDAKDDLPAFRATLDRMPWPFGGTTSVQVCAAAFVRAIERRQRRVYVPAGLAVAQAVRSLLVSPVSDRIIGRSARTSVPAMEAEVRALGRAFGRHTAAPGGDPEAG
ncbi:SDR family oxidoreductase [Plantactinospora sp. KBS50]|uniref:SDR family oxidoreductase n=1 Tax=Plantactinospora sp. KBS50 TaxID=2024580 RepID=UPI000BAA99DA|nr:SDR family oxidoreductase [Plantactinospora sp. KBS50]ASW57667.1 short-chain dehydrogenase [Plantactinospora sp. KBS50]